MEGSVKIVYVGRRSEDGCVVQTDVAPLSRATEARDVCDLSELHQFVYSGLPLMLGAMARMVGMSGGGSGSAGTG